MLLDDHEIEDNWEPVAVPDTQENIDKKTQGVAAYLKYQRGRRGWSGEFDFDGFHFFLLDTRTERTHRSVGRGPMSADLFSSTTMQRLQRWLKEKPAPKFVLSPAAAASASRPA
jgi:hypothetical protein